MEDKNKRIKEKNKTLKHLKHIVKQYDKPEHILRVIVQGSDNKSASFLTTCCPADISKVLNYFSTLMMSAGQQEWQRSGQKACRSGLTWINS